MVAQLRAPQRTITQRLSDESKRGQLDLTRDPLVPGIPAPGDDPASLRKSIIAIKNLLDQREGASGSVMDMNLTLRDLMNEGALALKVGAISYSAPSAVSSVSFGSGSHYTDNRPVFDTPPAATGLTAQGAFKNVILGWSLVDFKNFSYVEVWRSATNALGAAVLIGTSTANLYTDANVVVGTSYYYWVRAISTTSVAGPFNAVGGTLGGLLLVGGTDLGPLVVTADKLSQGTYPNINLVPNPGAEDGTEAWAIAETFGSGGALAVDAAVKTGGSQSFKLTKVALADGVGAGCRAFPVIPGETYSVKVKIRGTAASAGGLYIRMNELASKPTTGYIGTGVGGLSDVRTSFTDLVAGSSAIPAAWTTYEFLYTAPAGIFWASLAVYVYVASTTLSLNFDDCSVGRQITASFLAANSIAVGTLAVQNGALVNAMIGTLAVDDGKIANLDAVKLVARSITAIKIATNAITANEIAANTITAGQIAASTITAGQIAASTITTSRILVGEVSAAASSGTAAASLTGLASDITRDSGLVVVTSFTSTGAPVQITGNVLVLFSFDSTVDAVQINVDLRVDGATVANSYYKGRIVFGFLNLTLPLNWRLTPTAGSHSYGYRIQVSSLGTTSASIAMGVTNCGTHSAFICAQENKV